MKHFSKVCCWLQHLIPFQIPAESFDFYYVLIGPILQRCVVALPKYSSFFELFVKVWERLHVDYTLQPAAKVSVLNILLLINFVSRSWPRCHNLPLRFICDVCWPFIRNNLFVQQFYYGFFWEVLTIPDIVNCFSFNIVRNITLETVLHYKWFYALKKEGDGLFYHLFDFFLEEKVEMKWQRVIWSVFTYVDMCMCARVCVRVHLLFSSMLFLVSGFLVRYRAILQKLTCNLWPW